MSNEQAIGNFNTVADGRKRWQRRAFMFFFFILCTAVSVACAPVRVKTVKWQRQCFFHCCFSRPFVFPHFKRSIFPVVRFSCSSFPCSSFSCFCSCFSYFSFKENAVTVQISYKTNGYGLWSRRYLVRRGGKEWWGWRDMDRLTRKERKTIERRPNTNGQIDGEKVSEILQG